jgi:hypothetical protein
MSGIVCKFQNVVVRRGFLLLTDMYMVDYLLELPHMQPSGFASLSSLDITIQLTRDERSIFTTEMGPVRP